MIELGFKAVDMHELACHFVAEAAGLYADRGLDVRLKDVRHVPDHRLPGDLISVACGAAAMRWLHGEGMKVVFVATAKPMFWLYARDGIADIGQLRERRIAGFPGSAPPAHFLRIVLEDAGLLPDRDVFLDTAPDDRSRIEMLRSGRSAAALLSSAAVPDLVDDPDLHELLCLGDRLRLPTTGLAIAASALESRAAELSSLGDCFRSSLQVIHDDEEYLRYALKESRLLRDDNLDPAVRLLRCHFSPDGLVDIDDIQPGIQRLADTLGSPVAVGPAPLYGQVYRD